MKLLLRFGRWYWIVEAIRLIHSNNASNPLNMETLPILQHPQQTCSSDLRNLQLNHFPMYEIHKWTYHIHYDPWRTSRRSSLNALISSRSLL